MPSCNSCFNLKTLAVLLLWLLTVIFFIFFIIQTSTPESMLGGIQAQRTNATGTIIPIGGNVIFDTVLNDQSDNISYNSTTGEFTITKPGNYYVDWWVSARSEEGSLYTAFTLEVNGVPYSTASSLSGIEQLSGEALLTVTTVPTTIRLVNTSDDRVIIGALPVQANIVIAEVTR